MKKIGKIENRTSLSAVPLDGKWILAKNDYCGDGPFHFWCNNGICVVPPERFIMDGASVPKFAWHFMGHPFSDLLIPAVLHDYLYCTALESRKKSDLVFTSACMDCGVSLNRIRLAWLALRLFGKKHYNRGVKSISYKGEEYIASSSCPDIKLKAFVENQWLVMNQANGSVRLC